MSRRVVDGISVKHTLIMGKDKLLESSCQNQTI
jgi:hypothetical protein